MIKKLLLLPGDGIGCSVMAATLPLFKLLLPDTILIEGDIGTQFWQDEKMSIPGRTWKLINEADAILLGATTNVTTSDDSNYIPPTAELRHGLDLYVNARPFFNIKPGSKEFNFCIIRENSEGLYAGLDYSPLSESVLNLVQKKPQWRALQAKDASAKICLQTKAGLERIFHYAFAYAEKHSKTKVTFADKSNVMSGSDNFAKNCFENIASQYSDVECEILNVNHVAMNIVKSPESFEVIVAQDMFGDILSNVATGVMGGLGLTPSAHIGENKAYFEPAHGSAPEMELYRPNPSAMFLSIAMMFEHYGYDEYATWIKQSVIEVISDNKVVTFDLEGQASCIQMAAFIISKVKDLKDHD